VIEILTGSSRRVDIVQPRRETLPTSANSPRSTGLTWIRCQAESGRTTRARASSAGAVSWMRGRLKCGPRWPGGVSGPPGAAPPGRSAYRTAPFIRSTIRAASNCVRSHQRRPYSSSQPTSSNSRPSARTRQIVCQPGRRLQRRVRRAIPRPATIRPTPASALGKTGSVLAVPDAGVSSADRTPRRRP